MFQVQSSLLKYSKKDTQNEGHVDASARGTSSDKDESINGNLDAIPVGMKQNEPDTLNVT
jgi:hypothetical protein